MIKRLVTLVLILSFVFAIPMNVNAATDNLTYSFESGTLILGGSGNMGDYGTFSNTPWSAHKDDITRVIIGDDITSICQKAFEGCANLESVEISENSSLVTIGEFAFHGCSKLTSIYIPETVTLIDDNAFYNCSSLNNVTFAEGTNALTINASAFLSCISMTKINLPKRLVQLGGSAFGSNNNLKTIIIKSDTLDCLGAASGIFSSSNAKIIGCSETVLTKTGGASSMSEYFGSKFIDFHVDGDHDGYCDVCNTQNNPFSSVDMTLGTNLSMNYYTEIASLDKSKLSVDFSLNGSNQNDVSGVVVAGNKQSYTFSGVAPHYMNDGIDAVLKYDGIVIGAKNDFSVKNYLSSLSGEQEYLSSDTMKTLVADLLNYGAKAQEYKSYKVDQLVNSGWGIPCSEFNMSITTDMTRTDTTNANVKFTAAGVYHNNINKLYFKLKTDDIDNTKVYINSTEASIDEFEDDVFIVYSNDISALGFDTVYTVTIKVNGDVVQTLTYSIKSYVYSKRNGDDANANLAKALYNYGLSAKAFKG